MENQTIFKKFTINSTNEFHVLRHFKFVDNLYKTTLLNQQYWYYDYNQKKFVSSKISEIDIEYALETIGTKFEKNVSGIENPKKLLEIIKNKFQELLLVSQISWIDHIEHKTTTFSFGYKLPVGQINCLPKGDISEDAKNRIITVPRSNCFGEDSIKVNIISGIKLNFTKRISVEIVETKQLPFYMITAYPDCSISNDISFDKLVFVVQNDN